MKTAQAKIQKFGSLLSAMVMPIEAVKNGDLKH